MDPALAAALTPFLSALGAAVLMYATYRWPSGRNKRDDELEEMKTRLEALEDGDDIKP
jgi:hypothetical protein